MTSWVSWHQNVSILDFIGAKNDDGDDNNWSCNACKALVSVITNKPTPAFYRQDALPVSQQTVSEH